MPSTNVNKAIKTLKDNPVLALELSLSLAKIEATSEVKMTKVEKKEFMQELAESFSSEAFVVGGWI